MSLEIHYNVYGCFRDPRADVELAKDAVAAGFEGVWTGDHFMPWIDSRPYTHHVLPWFGTLMSEIPDVPVGTSVTCPTIRYRPPVLAQALATLDNMYPGRFNLGVGTGQALNEGHFYDGEWPGWTELADRLVESVEVMKRLWNDEEYVGYDGEYYQYDAIKLYTPPAGDIPIHWAGYGPQSCQRAGRHADHLLTVGGADHIEAVVVPNLKEGLEAAGRSFETVDVTTEFGANVGAPGDLVDEIREKGELIPGDTERDTPDPREIQRVADERLADMTDAEIREANNITDDPTELVEKLERLEEAGVSRVLVGSNCGDPRRTIRAFEEHVLPAFD
jgi:coenzyme F420-dependent glucose-6-phosphate dehydrogenase